MRLGTFVRWQHYLLLQYIQWPILSQRSSNVSQKNENKIKSRCNLPIQNHIYCVISLHWFVLDIQYLPKTNYYKIYIIKCYSTETDYFPDFRSADFFVCPRMLSLSFTITRETECQTFQYSLIHRIILCNKWRFDIKLKEEYLCNYHDSDDDNVNIYTILYCVILPIHFGQAFLNGGFFFFFFFSEWTIVVANDI